MTKTMFGGRAPSAGSSLLGLGRAGGEDQRMNPSSNPHAPACKPLGSCSPCETGSAGGSPKAEGPGVRMGSQLGLVPSRLEAAGLRGSGNINARCVAFTRPCSAADRLASLPGPLGRCARRGSIVAFRRFGKRILPLGIDGRLSAHGIVAQARNDDLGVHPARAHSLTGPP